jgi:hypothetical protein
MQMQCKSPDTTTDVTVTTKQEYNASKDDRGAWCCDTTDLNVISDANANTLAALVCNGIYIILLQACVERDPKILKATTEL